MPMITTTRRTAAVLAAGLVVALLAGCKSSEKVVVDSVEAPTWARCAMGQAFVMESTDDDPTQYGGGTEARKDIYCANEDTGALWWDRLDVYVRKYNGSYLCDTSPLAFTTSQRNVSISDSRTCATAGSSHIWSLGNHGAIRNGGGPIKREVVNTPEVYSY